MKYYRNVYLIVIVFIIYFSIGCTLPPSSKLSIEELDKRRFFSEKYQSPENLDNQMGFRGIKLGLSSDSIDLSKFRLTATTNRLKE